MCSLESVTFVPPNIAALSFTRLHVSSSSKLFDEAEAVQVAGASAPLELYSRRKPGFEEAPPPPPATVVLQLPAALTG